MFRKNSIVKGAFILTMAGFLSRLLGFFYRIFLSHTLGSAGLGLYQLIFPVSSFCYALCCSGIQTSISRFVAENENGSKNYSSKKILASGLFLSFSLSIISTFLVYENAGFISTNILQEASCAPLVKLLAFSIPLSSIHCCINGYYIGKKKASIPALTQFAEQIVRVISVYLIWRVSISAGRTINAATAVIGTVLGEAGSVVICMIALSLSNKSRTKFSIPNKPRSLFNTYTKKIFKMSFPLTLNKVLLTIFQSAEAILIPTMLKKYGLSSTEALSIYGVLTGMALPFILFPSAITNSISVMLLPEVASSNASNNSFSLTRTTSTTLKFCLIIGIFCTGIFSSYGNVFGALIYGNDQVGLFIIVLSWLCPFMYLNSTLTSILNGLGKTSITFVINMSGTILKILFIIFLIPKIGIIAYLWGLLISFILETFLHLIVTKKYIKIEFNAYSWILLPLYTILISIGFTYFIDAYVFSALPVSKLITTILSCALITVLYFGNIIRNQSTKSKS